MSSAEEHTARVPKFMLGPGVEEWTYPLGVDTVLDAKLPTFHVNLGRSTASSISNFSVSRLTRVCKMALRIRFEPPEPVAMHVPSAFLTTVGVIIEVIRVLGAQRWKPAG